MNYYGRKFHLIEEILRSKIKVLNMIGALTEIDGERIARYYEFLNLTESSIDTLEDIRDIWAIDNRGDNTQ